MEDKPFAGFVAIAISDDISWKFRIVKIASTFTAEALTIGETLEIVEKNRPAAQFCDFLGLGKRAKRN
jgi:hypothetical protein